jgi:hypothetical protein
MRVLAAGSLRVVWQNLMAHFPEPVETQFGPAGLLRERIETGESCDLFASANLAHPQALFASGQALSVVPFASNQLCLTVRSDVLRAGMTGSLCLPVMMCVSRPLRREPIRPGITPRRCLPAWAKQVRGKNAGESAGGWAKFRADSDGQTGG